MNDVSNKGFLKWLKSIDACCAACDEIGEDELTLREFWDCHPHLPWVLWLVIRTEKNQEDRSSFVEKLFSKFPLREMRRDWSLLVAEGVRGDTDEDLRSYDQAGQLSNIDMEIDQELEMEISDVRDWVKETIPVAILIERYKTWKGETPVEEHNT